MTKATIIPSLTNNPPSRANPAAFPTDGDSFLNDLPGVVSGVNTAATELNTWNAEVETFKNQSSTSQTNAASSSTASLTQARNAAASMVSLWVSGTTYPAGQIVYSNADGREYKRITAGAGTTDPSSDTTNWEPLGCEYITNYPDIRPTLDLNFAGSQTVDPRITFTRNSTATYFDKLGVMQTAGINQPRIDFDPVTGECKGLLIEEQRSNLLTYSGDFSNVAWNKAGASITTNTIVAPDGTLTASKLIGGTPTEEAYPAMYHGLNLVTHGTVFSESIFVKKGELNYLVISITEVGSNNNHGLVVDITTGAASRFWERDNINSVLSTTDVGNGWKRVSVHTTIPNGNGYRVCFGVTSSMISNTSPPAYTGDGTSGIYIWGAQLEAGSFPTSYIKTDASQVTRAADSASMTGTNFSSWYRQDEGSFSYEILRPENLFYPPVVAAGKATDQNYVGIDGSNSGPVPRVVVFAGGVPQAILNIGGAWVSGSNKGAAAYKLNDFAGVSNGESVQTDTSGTTPSTISELNIGWNGAQRLNSHIKRIAYYPKRLPNLTLQAITQP